MTTSALATPGAPSLVAPHGGRVGGGGVVRRRGKDGKVESLDRVVVVCAHNAHLRAPRVDVRMFAGPVVHFAVAVMLHPRRAPPVYADDDGCTILALGLSRVHAWVGAAVCVAHAFAAAAADGTGRRFCERRPPPLALLLPVPLPRLLMVVRLHTHRAYQVPEMRARL